MNAIRRLFGAGLRRTRYAARDLYHHLGLDRGLYQAARGGRIVNYHGICKADHLKFNTLFLTERMLEAQFKFFSEHFNVVTLEEYYRAAGTGFDICLTFDDGFANNYAYVLPLLEKYRLPATFFVTCVSAIGHDILWNDFLAILARYGPAEIGFRDERYRRSRRNGYVSQQTGQALADRLRAEGFEAKAEMMRDLYRHAPFKEGSADRDYWLQMTGQQIRQLAASPYATIGSHGYYHNDLTKMDRADAEDELLRSRRYLEGLIGKPVTSLAFPYGAYDENVVDAATASGFERLLAAGFRSDGDGANPLLRDRMTVNPFISLGNQMRAIVAGTYG